MTVVALDTHAVVKELKAVGFTDEQAEAVTRVVRRSQDLDLSSLATKVDLERGLAAVRSDLAVTEVNLEKKLAVTEANLEKKLAVTEVNLEKKLAETKTDIVRWVVGAIGLQTVAIIGAALALSRLILHP